ncbi:hypothetical protein RHSIM_RhsimUnG0215800 [Rhododendron simsii]|uniref:Uncharacterized protein n=1 Tax=Rhododendron simsii TaxID=118357 RepID=A0A834FTE5_RHOSS|nr:hypothetical protein RHSIM_RhsimUnG0215800 [Rhododendron simsii]
MKMQMRIVYFTEESDGEYESGSGVVGGESERSGGLWIPSQLCSEIGSKISQWASVSPSPTTSSSALCSGNHRGLGIHISFMLFDFTLKQMFGYDSENSPEKLSDKFANFVHGLMSLPLNIPGSEGDFKYDERYRKGETCFP